MLAGSFPPQFGGLADYNGRIFAGLSAEVDVRLYCRAPAREAAFSFENFSLLAFARLFRQIKADRPDVLLIQFTPYQFAENRWGISFFSACSGVFCAVFFADPDFSDGARSELSGSP